MGRLTLLLSLLFFVSCGTKATKEKIQEVLEQRNYTIECKSQGCFGSGKEKLEIKNNKVATYTFLDFSQESGPSEKTKEILWDSEKRKILQEIFERGIELNETEGFCTTTTQYVLTSWSTTIEFEDLNCEFNDKFETLIK
jgi:hypothetical protein